MLELNIAPAEEAVAFNVRRLSVEQTGEGRFRPGNMRQAGPGDRIFGGTLLAQGSLAAARTVRPDLAQHSLHAYFVKAGRAGANVEYAVEPVRDGGTFVSRRVTARDGEDVLCEMLMSFTAAGEAAADAVAMPEAPLPDEMEPLLPPPPPQGEQVMIPFDARHSPVQEGDVDFMWARLRAPLPDDALVHRTWLVNMSDMFSTARTPVMAPMTLDYALWLHGDCRLDGWILLATTRTPSDGTRTMVSRQIFVQGRLAATMAQEAYARPPRP
jgi:acyl-CoA thioesterase-2